MNRMHVLAFMILLFGLNAPVLADNPVCTPSYDAEGIKLHSTHKFRMDEKERMREDSTERYHSGLWLALACKKNNADLFKFR